MPLDTGNTRNYLGQAADVEKHLGKAMAQARVLSFALRNQQPANVNRLIVELTQTLDDACGLLMPIAIATEGVERTTGEDA